MSFDCADRARRVIEHGVDGLLVAAADEAALARAIAALIADEPLRRRLGAAAIVQGRGRSGVDAVGERWDALVVAPHRRVKRSSLRGMTRAARGPRVGCHRRLNGSAPTSKACERSRSRIVLLAHAGLGFAGGGYVGVDVFFVISGFLITQLLVRELDRRGRVCLARFYARRVKRLMPRCWP